MMLAGVGSSSAVHRTVIGLGCGGAFASEWQRRLSETGFLMRST